MSVWISFNPETKNTLLKKVKANEQKLEIEEIRHMKPPDFCPFIFTYNSNPCSIQVYAVFLRNELNTRLIISKSIRKEVV